MTVTDRDDHRVLELRNGALHHRTGVAPEADASVRMTHAGLIAIGLGTATLEELLADGRVEIDHERAVIDELLAQLDTFETWFPIAEP